MIKVDDFRRAIIGMSRENLCELNDTIREELRTQSNRKAQSFAVGQAVWFNDKRGRRIDGTVAKKNRVTIKVMASNNVSWRVAPDFLHTTDGDSY